LLRFIAFQWKNLALARVGYQLHPRLLLGLPPPVTLRRNNAAAIARLHPTRSVSSDLAAFKSGPLTTRAANEISRNAAVSQDRITIHRANVNNGPAATRIENNAPVVSRENADPVVFRIESSDLVVSRENADPVVFSKVVALDLALVGRVGLGQGRAGLDLALE